MVQSFIIKLFGVIFLSCLAACGSGVSTDTLNTSQNSIPNGMLDASAFMSIDAINPDDAILSVDFTARPLATFLENGCVVELGIEGTDTSTSSNVAAGSLAEFRLYDPEMYGERILDYGADAYADETNLVAEVGFSNSYFSFDNPITAYVTIGDCTTGDITARYGISETIAD